MNTWTEVATWSSTKTEQTFTVKSGEYTVPASVGYIQLWISFSNNTEVTNKFYIDNIIIMKKYGGNLIVDGAITAAKIAANTITSNEIAANTITATQIAADTITSNQIASNAITSNEVAANAIIAGKIATNAVTAATIAAGSVDATKINVTSLSAITADLGTVNAGTLNGVTMNLSGAGLNVNGAGSIQVTASDKWGANAAIKLQNADITGLNGLYMKDVADNEGEGVLFLKNGKVAGDYTDSINDYYTLRVDGAGTLLLDGKPVAYSGQGNFLYDGAAYPNDGYIINPTRTLANCPNGWIIVWSDFDSPSTANNYNWYTSVIPKYVGDNGNNWSFAIPVGSSTGSYDTMASKQLTIYNDKIVGEAGNSSGISADVVLRYVIAF
jgi:hypothetical protein